MLRAPFSRIVSKVVVARSTSTTTTLAPESLSGSISCRVIKTLSLFKRRSSSPYPKARTILQNQALRGRMTDVMKDARIASALLVTAINLFGLLDELAGQYTTGHQQDARAQRKQRGQVS